MKWLACLCQGPPPVEQLFTSSHVYTPVVNSICLDKTAIVAVLRIEKVAFVFYIADTCKFSVAYKTCYFQSE